MERRPIYRLACGTVALTASAFLLTGCAGAHPHRTTSLPAPVALDIRTVAGTEVDIARGNSAYIVVPDGSEASYTGRVTGNAVKFVAGSITDDLVLRPGLTATTKGLSIVTLTNTLDGAVSQFIVHVE